MLNTRIPKGLIFIALEGIMTQHSKTNESIWYTINIDKIQTERIDKLFFAWVEYSSSSVFFSASKGA